MREIKFRCWDEQRKVMLLPESVGLLLQLDGTLNSHDLGIIQGSSNTPKMSLMQYTGLKDRNGKEIYEGDILRFSAESFLIFTDEVGEVQWGTAGWVLTREQLVLCDLEDACPDECVDGEVIGNIYENPELLETQGNK